ncbi:MAG: excinuclease ABC subunit UvrA, partial [Candidatus Chisholmbacteria bacterium]|nr:excinuclease ABC subunit UvrA [Candidatus Chisholmbacteria bacterium]
FTGVSGSGKSSLAFDTLYAEGQRRYVESLSSYARQFLGLMDKPDVDSIDGLSPAISIDQKTTSHNPRSTVGTITEIYDYLRLLYARIGHPHCPKCGREIASQSPQQIVDHMLESVLQATHHTPLARFLLLSPLVRGRKGEFKDLFSNLKKQGFQKARIDHQVYDLDANIFLLKNNPHTIEVIIERFTFDNQRTKSPSVTKQLRSRLTSSVETALKLSDGLVILSQVTDKSFEFPQKPRHFQDHLYSESFACPIDNISLPEIEPRLFSFNSPHGACPACHGLGFKLKVDPDLIIAPNLSIPEGAIIPYAAAMAHDTWFRRTVATVLDHHGFSITTPFKHLPSSIQKLILYGTGSQKYTVSGTNLQGRFTQIHESFAGFVPHLERRYAETDSDYIRQEIHRYLRQETCPQCQGARLKPEALSVTISGENIWQITQLPIDQTLAFINSLPQHISGKEQTIANLILKELHHRLEFLVSVGLTYLTLSRQATTLAGGEAQRIRLASQIGTGLTGVLYVLDEPTIGLHPRDNLKLIHTLKHLKNLGNTVIVVEHDQETMQHADWIIDFGPGAGKEGGHIIAQGTPTQIKSNQASLTGQYLSGKKKINLTNQLITNQLTYYLTIAGCTEFNLKNLTVNFPLGKLICITGVSGSGKSTLIHTTLYHALAKSFNPYHKEKAGAYKALTGTDPIGRVSLITPSPIGRTPRSNPVTYTKAFHHIRDLFAQTPEAKIRGYKPGRFSFNVKGGRCENCQGGGEVKIQMQFLPDVYVKCDVCQGHRYNSETLEVHYKDKTISQVLNLTVDEALKFFSAIPAIHRKLFTLQQVGLGYIELGQPAPQLSGGEAQRVKLAKELSVHTLSHTVYLLDEPTTGLHFEDLTKLLHVLKALVAQGNTVIVIEHNLSLIKNADWIIDLGPEGGDRGGEIVAQGPPRKVAQNKHSYTGQFLKKLLH